MHRRAFLSNASALAAFGIFLSLSTAVRAEDAERLDFDEMYASSGPLGLEFSQKLLGLNGKKTTVEGFMAPPLKADAKFLVLTKTPVSLCPFCSTDEDWPDSIIVVYLSKKQDFVQNNRLIAVTGTLEVGSRTDEETGFVSLVRLVDARFSVV